MEFDINKTVSYWFNGAKYDLSMEFHFEARYPDVTKAFYKKCTRTYTAQKLKEMKEVIIWIKSKL